MIITETTDKFLPCRCGHTMTEYTIGYGRTPYGFICKCGKTLADAKCLVTGAPDVLFDYWNSKLRFQTKQQIIGAKKRALKRKESYCDEDKPIHFQHYWLYKSGAILDIQW